MTELRIDVPGQGNPNAQIMIIGEGPGEQEVKKREPFVGPSGNLLNQVLNACGISRSECWITNVYKCEIPDNDLKHVKNLLPQYKQYLINEIRTVNPRIILALGNTPLHALSGNTGIKEWRGSILHNPDTGKRFIPTYHPAFILRTDSIIDKSVMEFDVRRLLDEASYPPLPQRNLVVIRNSAQLINYVDRWKDKPNLAADIETYKAVPSCVGFAPSPHEAISIPLFNELWGVKFNEISDSELAIFWQIADSLLRNKGIIGQNWKFDEGKLRQMGFRMPNFVADTMHMAHTRYPEMPKGLGFLASIHTREPFYKHEGKEFNPKRDNSDILYLYNAKDCAVEYEVYEVLKKELEDFGVLDFYQSFVRRLHHLYLDVESQGILHDPETRYILFQKYNALLECNNAELEALVGHPVNINSPKQIGHLIYAELKLPQREGTGEEVLVALAANHGEKFPRAVPVINCILRGRAISKTIGTYINACPDYDARYRTSYQIVGTETGRTSTKTLKPPTRPEPIGLAFQTITKHSEMGEDVLSMLVPDPGYVYLEVDGSQAEARVVDFLAEDFEGLAEYEILDKHLKTARICLGLGPDYPLTKKSPERFIGKKVRHAASYDMQKYRAMIEINTDAEKYGINVHISEWRAGQYLKAFHDANPKIKAIFHEGIQYCLTRNNRILVTPFGRKRQFAGRWNDQLFKEGYAHIPQSTIGDNTKRAMLYVKDQDPQARICIEKHDAFGCLVPVAEVDKYARIMKEGMELPIDFQNCSLPRGTLIIPSEFEIGVNNLRDLEGYKMGSVNPTISSMKAADNELARIVDESNVRA